MPPDTRPRRDPPDRRPRRDAPADEEPRWIPDQAELDAIIGGDVDRLITSAESVGRGLQREGLTTSQVRGVFGTVRQIEGSVGRDTRELDSEAARRLKLLVPRLAYQEGREREQSRRGRPQQGIRWLRAVLAPAIGLVGADVNRFRRFVEYFEAILAYHKASGGRD
jgi:CRISPR-associated protein Csm2